MGINFLVVRAGCMPRSGLLEGGLGEYFHEKSLLNGAIWCVLEHNFILYLLKKYSLFMQN